MVQFESIKVPKISETIVENIEKFIITGALKKGEKLPSERDLAEQLNVSRPSIREAISILEAKGLLTSKRGGGTFVTDNFADELSGTLPKMMQDHPEMAFDILELRHALEEVAAYYAALRATTTDKEIIQRRLDKLLECYASEKIDPELESKSDVEFHLSIADASHNFALVHVMRNLFDALHAAVSMNLDRIREYPEEHKIIQSQHVSICDAILAGDADLAKQHAHEHLSFVAKKLTEFSEHDQREQQAKQRLGGNSAALLNLEK